MEISQRISTQQGLKQEQQMTHQQIQALEMLASPVMELQAMIAAEMEKNPILEVENPDETSPMMNEEPPAAESADDSDQWLEQLVNLEERNPLYLGQPASFSSDDEEKRNHYLNSITKSLSLHEEIENQLFFLDLSEDDKALCELVINSLNDDGYLNAHIADLAMISGRKIDDISRIVKVIQQLEPAGIAAVDLKERLLLQLERQGYNQDDIVWRVIDKHLDDIGNNRLPVVVKALDIGMDQLRDALDVIRDLRPRLRNGEQESSTTYVKEELTVFENEDAELEVSLIDRYLPHLSISPMYQQMLKDPDLADEARDYIRDKVRGATFLINSIEQRQGTLKKIADSIVTHQEDFFRKGKDFMKPLTMAQVADEIGVHETTVSRGVAGKYLQCKYGILPLKFFFSAGYQSDDGNSVSNIAVKERIKALIDAEDSAKPLSDSKISEILNKEGLKVARRTVAKYRESMKIAPSKLRRTYWTT